MLVKYDKIGGIDIFCHGQLVLNIGETSDVDTINLFLTPFDGHIINTPKMDDFNPKWTHEVLTNRNEESKKLFIKNEPLYKIMWKDFVMITVTFVRERSCKHSVRFSPFDKRAEAVTSILYIKNKILETLGQPKTIEVTIDKID